MARTVSAPLRITVIGGWVQKPFTCKVPRTRSVARTTMRSEWQHVGDRFHEVDGRRVSAITPVYEWRDVPVTVYDDESYEQEVEAATIVFDSGERSTGHEELATKAKPGDRAYLVVLTHGDRTGFACYNATTSRWAWRSAPCPTMPNELEAAMRRDLAPLGRAGIHARLKDFTLDENAGWTLVEGIYAGHTKTEDVMHDHAGRRVAFRMMDVLEGAKAGTLVHALLRKTPGGYDRQPAMISLPASGREQVSTAYDPTRGERRKRRDALPHQATGAGGLVCLLAALAMLPFGSAVAAMALGAAGVGATARAVRMHAALIDDLDREAALLQRHLTLIERARATLIAWTWRRIREND